MNSGHQQETDVNYIIYSLFWHYENVTNYIEKLMNVK